MEQSCTKENTTEIVVEELTKETKKNHTQKTVLGFKAESLEIIL